MEFAIVEDSKKRVESLRARHASFIDEPSQLNSIIQISGESEETDLFESAFSSSAATEVDDSSCDEVQVAQADTKTDKPKDSKDNQSKGAKPVDVTSNQETSATRAARWRERFASGKLSTEAVRETVDDLIRNRKYEEVISCLEQAIIHGRMEPWMYEVLALSMEVAGRPKAQIERVLLSSQDLVTNNATSMMVLAAYLTRFERYERALELYRQAAHLQPERPEAYLQALTLAKRTKNAEAIVWCAPEVLTYAWGSDRDSLRRDAEQAAADAISALTRAGKLAKAVELQQAMQRARELDLVVRLDWNGQGDLDLSVEEPKGTVCSIHSPVTSAGGIFGHDGFGPNQSKCFDEYLCPRALSGQYKIRVRHAGGDIVGKRARLTITRGKGTPHETAETQTVLLGPDDVVIRISLSNGRRDVTDNRPQTLGPVARVPRPEERTALLAQIANNPVAQVGVAGGAGFGNVGYQPVIQLINEGITMNALATVSGDRRYVRISTQPVFSNITDVFTFSFISSGGQNNGR